MKGETSYKKTKFGILPRSKVLRLEILGTQRGLRFLSKKVKDKIAISPGFIKELHKVSFSDILSEDAGKFRLERVTYSGKEAPLPYKIPMMMKELCDNTEYLIQHLPKEYEEEFVSKLIELLSYFQHQYVLIHPFIDYNGRTRRMLTSYILMRLGYPIIEIKVDSERRRRSYIKALQEADNGDYHRLKRMIGVALNESLENILK